MKNRLKRTISAVLTLSLLMSICALPSLAAGGEGADSAQGTFELLKNIAVTDSPYTPEGDYSFYLYSPSDPHDFDLMSGSSTRSSLSIQTNLLPPRRRPMPG